MISLICSVAANQTLRIFRILLNLKYFYLKWNGIRNASLAFCCLYGSHP